jgi:hypothetical protein
MGKRTKVERAQPPLISPAEAVRGYHDAVKDFSPHMDHEDNYNEKLAKIARALSELPRLTHRESPIAGSPANLGNYTLRQVQNRSINEQR